MMERVFEGSPSQATIKRNLDKALRNTNQPISEDTYQRAGSVLVTFRKEYGISEMDQLDCIAEASEGGRGTSLKFGDIAALCVTLLASGR